VLLDSKDNSTIPTREIYVLRVNVYPFLGFFQHKTGMTIAETGSVGCMDLTNKSASFGAGAECNTTFGGEVETTMPRVGTH
jgi:hypothetical protein